MPHLPRARANLAVAGVLFGIALLIAWLVSGRRSQSDVLAIPSEQELKAAFPAGMKEAFETAPSFTLLSLQPEGPLPRASDERDPLRFHGYKVLGRLPIRAAEVRRRVLDHLYDAIAGSQEQAMCFIPRHAFQAITADGRRFDLIICFHCKNMQAYTSAGKSDYRSISDRPRDFLNEILNQNGIPVAR